VVCCFCAQTPPAPARHQNAERTTPHPTTPPTAGKDAKATASKAAAAVKKNSWARTRKPRYSVVFHRPKTLKRTRDPKYTRTRCVACLFVQG
jgi:hypothetical protein